MTYLIEHGLPVLVSSIAYMLLGMLWYNKAVFGKVWVVLTLQGKNITESELKKHAGTAIFGSFIASLFMACILRVILLSLGVATFIQGLQYGLYIGIGFVATIMLIDSLYALKPLKLYGITAGYHIVGIMVMSVIIASWG